MLGGRRHDERRHNLRVALRRGVGSGQLARRAGARARRDGARLRRDRPLEAWRRCDRPRRGRAPPRARRRVARAWRRR
eukprot:3298485-Prymnesium_polylepis.1